MMKMTKMTPHNVFLRAMEDRITNRPFDSISAYKVRESHHNISRMTNTLNEIIAVVSSGQTHSVPILLGGCTTEDKSIWLKDLPGNLAEELGYNLIPAIQALNVEGVPEAAIDRFIQSIKADVCQLLKDCDAMQTDTGLSIKGEYARMKAGCSEMLRICNDALVIADQAVSLCDIHAV
jgi:hypothetical protein